MKLPAVKNIPVNAPSLTGGWKRAHPRPSTILTPSKGSNPVQQINSCQSDVSVSDPGWRCGFFYFQEFQKAPPCPWSPKAMWRKHRVHLQNLQAPQNLLSQPNPERQRKSPKWRREAFVMVWCCLEASSPAAERSSCLVVGTDNRGSVGSHTIYRLYTYIL